MMPMTDRRQTDRRTLALPPLDGVDTRATERRRGRPPLPDTRRHRLRIACNSDELAKFRLLADLHHGLKINTMARDIILDEVNAMLSESPRHELVERMKEKGFTDVQIEAILGSL